LQTDLHRYRWCRRLLLKMIVVCWFKAILQIMQYLQIRMICHLMALHSRLRLLDQHRVRLSKNTMIYLHSVDLLMHCHKNYRHCHNIRHWFNKWMYAHFSGILHLIELFQDAFSMLCYEKPRESMRGYLLDSNQRTSVAKALNSAILGWFFQNK
jgi:hypothetical protein